MAKAFDKNITKKNVSEWYKRLQSIQQFSSRSTRFPQFKIASNNPNEWQMDLAFWEKQPIIISVNINSRIGFAKLLINKRAETVLKAIEDFVGKTFQLYFLTMAVSLSTNPLNRSLMSTLLVMVIRSLATTLSLERSIVS
ncbi:unnamed protein product [Phytophthora fragariaefolia]|uniref:Unnamed protein product n=1 Tax=Phytophthora fragariaefolia TaxID=1490495 RepID=A0A9W6TKG1_9STRA|nr:unnamed protein product [Phytophthora fragariaefolia]